MTRSAWLRALAVAGLINGLFVVLTVSTAALPRETLRERVRAAFHAGHLTQEGATGVCAMLRELTLDDNGQVTRATATLRYSRYWHGYNSIAATLLLAFDLATVRWFLKGAVYSSLVALVLTAGVTHRRVLGVAAAISATAALFWGLPYFGQSLSHAPGDAFVVLALGLLLFARRRLFTTAVVAPVLRRPRRGCDLSGVP